MERIHTLVAVSAVAALSLVASACGGGADVDSRAEQRYPDIVAATATPDGGGSWSFTVTVSSPYDTPERYADGWRVLGPGDAVLGEHTLLHDHAGEQPFTRTQRGVDIPDDVDVVTIEGRDRQYGYGGDTIDVALHDASDEPAG